MLLMNLESKPVIFEDIARQVLANGFRKQPDVYMRIIGECISEILSFRFRYQILIRVQNS